MATSHFFIPPRTSSITLSNPTARVARAQAADAFVANHTAPDDSVPLLEECPICLDNYRHETCVRITGIAGCNHRIGLTCLTELLRSHAELEKKCPLCRAVWIAGPIAVPRRRRRDNADLSATRGPDVVFVGPLNPTHAAAANAARSDPDNTARIADRIRVSQLHHRLTDMPQRELINLDTSSSDEDYDTQVQNFNDFTRDIENIRSRARNTQFPRHVRRHSLAQQQSTRGTADQSAEVATGSGVGRLLGRSLNPFRPMTHNPLIRERNNEFMRRCEAVLQASVEPHRIDVDAPRLSLEHMRLSPIAGLRTPSFASNEDAMEVVELPADEVPQARDAVRARQLDQREMDLSARERALNTRLRKVERQEMYPSANEQKLQGREAALAERERDVGSREQKVEQVVQTMRMQRNEMEALVRRQMMELDDSLERI